MLPAVQWGETCFQVHIDTPPPPVPPKGLGPDSPANRAEQHSEALLHKPTICMLLERKPSATCTHHSTAHLQPLHFRDAAKSEVGCFQQQTSLKIASLPLGVL